MCVPNLIQQRSLFAHSIQSQVCKITLQKNYSNQFTFLVAHTAEASLSPTTAHWHLAPSERGRSGVLSDGESGFPLYLVPFTPAGLGLPGLRRPRRLPLPPAPSTWSVRHLLCAAHAARSVLPAPGTAAASVKRLSTGRTMQTQGKIHPGKPESGREGKEGSGPPLPWGRGRRSFLLLVLSLLASDFPSLDSSSHLLPPPLVEDILGVA